MTGQNVFRLEPAGPVQAYQSFELRRPAGGQFWRRATCEEVGCLAWQHGWNTRVPAGSPQASYIDSRRHGRTFIEITGGRELAEGVRTFQFVAGQECFASGSHQVAVEREPLAIVRDGDWRGNPTGRVRRHRHLADWRDDMQEQLGHLAEEKQRG